MGAATTLREIPLGSGVCPVCDTIVPLASSKARKVGDVAPLYVHGPRRSPCAGSGERAKPWIEVQGLPTWDDMSDLDRGCALMFLWKCHWERSYRYARENYPCRYQDNPVLVGLSVEDACRHASAVGGSHAAILDRLGIDEHQRLYNLAVDAELAAYLVP